MSYKEQKKATHDAIREYHSDMAISGLVLIPLIACFYGCVGCVAYMQEIPLGELIKPEIENSNNVPSQAVRATEQ